MCMCVVVKEQITEDKKRGGEVVLYLWRFIRWGRLPLLALFLPDSAVTHSFYCLSAPAGCRPPLLQLWGSTEKLRGGRWGSQTHQPRCDSASCGSLYSPSGSLNLQSLHLLCSCICQLVRLVSLPHVKKLCACFFFFFFSPLRFHLELSSRSTALHEYFEQCLLNRVINWPEGGRSVFPPLWARFK